MTRTVVTHRQPKSNALHTDQKIGYSQIKEEVVALISEALVHNKGEDDQRVSHDHHDHQDHHQGGEERGGTGDALMLSTRVTVSGETAWHGQLRAAVNAHTRGDFTHIVRFFKHSEVSLFPPLSLERINDPDLFVILGQKVHINRVY